MSEIVLHGLDGSNPLGLLAALGVLRSLGSQGVDARLHWTQQGWWRPVLTGPDSLDDVVDALEAERLAWADEPALTYSYTDAKGKIQRELKPPPAEFRRFLAQVLDSDRARSLRQIGAYASELVTDNNGNTKPTALHFAAGQQRFLDICVEIQREADRDRLRNALQGPWVEHKTKSLSWDSSVFRDYALRARDPSGDKKGSVTGAEWLAFLGLALFPVAPTTSPRGVRLQTTGCTGGWKDGSFTWPLWGLPATEATVRSLLLVGDRWSARQRAVLGVQAVFTASIRRSDQGGYGSFTPARPT